MTSVADLSRWPQERSSSGRSFLDEDSARLHNRNHAEVARLRGEALAVSYLVHVWS